MEYNVITLEHGLRLVCCELQHTRTAAAGVWVGTGGRYESAAENGISHFLEHLAFKGTPRRSFMEIKEQIEGRGGSLNGFTSEEATCFFAKTLAAHLPDALDVLLDMTFNPLLGNKDVEKERQVIVEEIKMYHDVPQHFVYDALGAILWPGHPLGFNLAGTAACLAGISRKILRESHARNYQPANCVITVCGNCAQARALKIVQRFFKNKQAGVYNKTGYVPAPPVAEGPRFSLTAKDIEQTHFCLGMHALSREHPLRHAMSLLHIILGANMSSRLFNEIREEKGLAYEIGTSTKRFSDCGAFIVQAGVLNEKVDEALALTLKELHKIRKTPVSQNEFTRAKDYYIGQLLMGLEDTGDHMLWMGESMIARNKIKGEADIIREVRATTIGQVREAAQQIFQRSRMNLAVIGPLAESRLQRLQSMVEEF